MLERDLDWNEFQYCVKENKLRSVVSAHFGLHLETVEQYAQMHAGVDFLKIHGRLPDRLAKFAVGFKYRSLNIIRWFQTDDIKRARAEYDIGKIELATGTAIVKDNPAWVLYAIPRATPANRPLYFSAPVFA